MDTTTKLDRAQLAQKIRWEGGLFAALDYGIRPEDIEDPELAFLWARLEQSYGALAPILDEARIRLGVAA